MINYRILQNLEFSITTDTIFENTKQGQRLINAIIRYNIILL